MAENTNLETEMTEHIILQMEKERGLDRSAAIADMRFAFIAKVSEAAVRKPQQNPAVRPVRRPQQIQAVRPARRKQRILVTLPQP